MSPVAERTDRVGPRSEPRQRILRAAATAIAENGYHGMGLRELSKAAGMSLSNLYNYFSSKEEMLFALQKEAFEVLVASAEEALEIADAPEDRLYVFISHHVRYVAEHPRVMRVLVHEAASLPAEQRAVVRSLKERYFELARGLVADVVETGCGRPAAGDELDPAELDRITYNVFGMLNWLYGWYEPKVHGEPQTVAMTIFRITLCGVVTDCPRQNPRESLDLHLSSVEARPLLGGAGEAGDDDASPDQLSESGGRP
ncbi:MAG: TetR/AcrR family transcriptional regulator [Acidobacteriota bacterium]